MLRAISYTYVIQCFVSEFQTISTPISGKTIVRISIVQV